MNVLLLTIGSAGDVHPFIGIGQELRRRGHRVQVIVNPHFGNLVTRAGLEHVPLGEETDYTALRENPYLWHPRRSPYLIFDAVSRSLRNLYDTLMAHYTPGHTVVAASSLAIAARIAQEKHGIPLATVHLAPAVFRSLHRPPKLPGVWMPPWLPRGIKRGMYAIGDRHYVDPALAPAVNALQAELGLSPVRSIMGDWWNSPQRVIGLFPDWFGEPQPDWPSQTVLTGFPLYDEADLTPLQPAVESFLAAGDAPIVFTPGSAMHHAHRFFETAVAACRRLNRRGILLSRHPGHIPADLPPEIVHFDFVPLSRLLPHTAAIVHHGGIGTTAQALRAGVPQLICPFSYDQFDNALRLGRLGVAGTLSPRNLRTSSLAAVLTKLIRIPSFRSAAGAAARKLAGVDSLDQTASLILALTPTDLSNALGKDEEPSYLPAGIPGV